MTDTVSPRITDLRPHEAEPVFPAQGFVRSPRPGSCVGYVRG